MCLNVTADLIDQIWDTLTNCGTHHVCGNQPVNQILHGDVMICGVHGEWVRSVLDWGCDRHGDSRSGGQDLDHLSLVVLSQLLSALDLEVLDLVSEVPGKVFLCSFYS